MTGRALDDWLRRLDRLIAHNGDRVAWSLKRLP